MKDEIGGLRCLKKEEHAEKHCPEKKETSLVHMGTEDWRYQ
ncbi:hypothetical protein [Ruminobacter sp.]|nr:hypothetical protein [Ruminobacter sp.]